ncbi:YicC family protein [Pseudomethylobacillus aquaticus]|uniref:YicC family protein n=1 Tax=Pseudomethylobacillus aquaticus TaxID=2676064 RepID=A0A3N0V1Z1_9PROT|nr:YicC/YloC family endoribonuclease [Pseudomethylobacillus aquaticus]ROH86826.1 YicC family protein [Pseudomethylobacillus aquaticus]
MIYSMTGFAAIERETAAGVVLLELRSVNHRYLELQLKLDDHLRSFEPMLREQINAGLGRGKVECRLALVQRGGQKADTTLDGQALQQLWQLSQAVQQQFPHSAPLSVADILRWPGVLATQTLDQDELNAEVGAALQQALLALREARGREGAKLKAIILERLAGMEALVQQSQALLPAQLQAYQQRLAAKLQEALNNVDEERLRQELVLYAQRVDVDEELGRLTAHISEVKRILAAGGAAGKQLDFLMQELNREANTLGSKSVSSEVSQIAMGLKVLIEQMREQIQNIE